MEETKELSPVDELIELGTRMKRDKARLEELCRQIAGAAQPAAGPGIEEARAARKASPRKKSAAPGKPEYWKKVCCSVCNALLGSRVYDGQRYPVLHKDQTTGETCKGSFAVARVPAAQDE